MKKMKNLNSKAREATNLKTRSFIKISFKMDPGRKIFSLAKSQHKTVKTENRPNP
jgi:hypothetical protein